MVVIDRFTSAENGSDWQVYERWLVEQYGLLKGPELVLPALRVGKLKYFTQFFFKSP